MQTEFDDEYFESLGLLQIENANLKSKVDFLTAENKQLKEEILKLALENSDLNNFIKKKKEPSEVTAKRWMFYHNNKQEIKEKLMKTNPKVSWFDVKNYCDNLFDNM